MPEAANLVGTHASDFPQGAKWLNSGPISLRQKDKIFLIEFWTYSCVNCLRVLPYLNRWHQKYSDAGLVVIGVHTPEFAFEKEEANVAQAIQSLAVTFPVVLDSDYKIWNSYSNRWWPRKLLVSSSGKIVYDHIGEGGYEETEAVIYELLRKDLKLPQDRVPPQESLPSGTGGVCYQTTPEVFLGYERGRLGFGTVVRDKAADYKVPNETMLHQWYLSGKWIVKPEYSEHVAPASGITDFLLFRYQAVSVNCVIAADRPTDVTIMVDQMSLMPSGIGNDVRSEDGKSILRVSEPRMYNVIKDTVYHEGELKFIVKDPGVRFYAFTFSGCPGQI